MNNSSATSAENGTAVKMTKLSFVERAMAFLKGGDEAKLARLETKTGKYFKEQHSIRDRKIDKLREQIEDAQEAFNEAVPNIDLSAIATSDGLDRYIPEYVAGLDRKLAAITELEDQIETLEAEKARLTQIESAIYQ